MGANQELSNCCLILENLADVVLFFDANLRLTYINHSGEMLLAGSARHFMGAHISETLRCRDSSVEDDLLHAIETGVAISQKDMIIERAEDNVTVNFFASPILDGAVVNSVLVEMQQVDRQLKISREEQLMTQQNASRLLLRGLAHEIKNPLGGLRGAAQLLDQELDEEFREYTRIIIDESDRLQSLMDRMLGPNKPTKKVALNIHKILERVRQLVSVETPDGVVVVRDYDPSIPDLRADHDQLIQAILNVVRNAAQAVGEHGKITLRTRIHRQVTIGSQRNKMAIRVDIADTGPGIKAEILEQIFYPMVTSRAEGTGLGLSIAQSLINQHGGLIECASTPGHTLFSIYLPLEDRSE